MEHTCPASPRRDFVMGLRADYTRLTYLPFFGGRGGGGGGGGVSYVKIGALPSDDSVWSTNRTKVILLRFACFTFI